MNRKSVLNLTLHYTFITSLFFNHLPYITGLNIAYLLYSIFTQALMFIGLGVVMFSLYLLKRDLNFIDSITDNAHIGNLSAAEIEDSRETISSYEELLKTKKLLPLCYVLPVAAIVCEYYVLGGILLFFSMATTSLIFICIPFFGDWVNYLRREINASTQ